MRGTRSRLLARRFLTLGTALVLLAGFELVEIMPASASSPTATQTFSYSSSVQTWTVPADVTQLTMTLTGAEGAQGGRDASGTAPPGGYQGVVTGTVTVTPGELLTIGIGSGGINSPDWNTCTTGVESGVDPADSVGGTNPLAGYDGGNGGSPGVQGCSGYGGAGGAASVVELGTNSDPTALSTIVAGGSGGSGGSGQYYAVRGQISLPTYEGRTDSTSTDGQAGLNVYNVCTLYVPGTTNEYPDPACDGGGGAGGGGGAQGGSHGLVDFGSASSNEWFGLGANPGENSTIGNFALSGSYAYYANDNSNGSLSISYDTGIPGPPVNVVGTAGNDSVSLNWGAPTITGSSPISDYLVQYSSDGGAQWTTIDTGSTTTSTMITGLTNGTSYEFQVAAENSVGTGAYAQAPVAVSPEGLPGAPTITAITPSNGSLSVAFSAGSSSLPILGYQYSVNGGTTWVPAGVTTSPLVINGLTNGTQYPVEIEAVNSDGSGAASNSVLGTPSAVPGAPTITSIVPGATSLTVNFTPGYTGGSSITGYEYQLSANGGAYGSEVPASGTTSPITITGLTSGTTYNVELSAGNVNGYGPASTYAVGVTLAAPQAPTISLTPGDSAIQVAYSGYTSSNDGGSPISEVDYSLNGGTTWINAGSLANPFTISGLTNGTAYSVIVRADNAIGDSPVSNSASAIPATVANPPTGVFVAPASSSTVVSWLVPSNDGGSPIIGYVASAYINGTTTTAFATCTATALTCSIPGLSAGSTYYVSVTAQNGVGSSLASSPEVQVVPVAAPGAPTLSGVTPGDTDLSISFNTGSTGTDAISSYQYTVDGGTTWQNAVGTSSPIVISGLTNGTSYTVSLRAVSAAGSGATSTNAETGTPFGVPATQLDSAISTTASSGSVVVSWTAPNDNGSPIGNYTVAGNAEVGYTVTAYSALVNGTQAATCTTNTATTCTLTGLYNGSTYYISLQSGNAAGYSGRSEPLIPVTPGTPSTTTLTNLPSSPSFGQSVTLTATISPGSLTTSTVNFELAGSSISGCSAQSVNTSYVSTCTTSALPTGSDAITAAFSGDATYSSSASQVLNLTISKTTTATLLSALPASSTHGGSVTLTASVTSGATGTVNFEVGGVTISGCGAQAINTSTHLATCATTTLVGGDDSLTAVYSGDANFGASTSTATSFVVATTASATSLSALPTSSTYGGSVTLTASVTSGATGTVNFEVGGVTISGCGVQAINTSTHLATCATSMLSPGDDSLTAVYSGDANFGDSTSTATSFVVASTATSSVVATTASATSLSALPTSSTYGGSVTLTASVTSGATGTVNFEVGGVTISGCGAQAINTSTHRATCATSMLSPGDDSLTAVYSGDANYAVSTSSPISFSVSKGIQSVSFTSSAPVDPTVGGSYTPAATSTSGLTPIVSVDVSSSSACSISNGLVTFLAIGDCTLDANQAGNSLYNPSSQSQLSFTVGAVVVASAPSNTVTNVTNVYVDITSTNGKTGTGRISWTISNPVANGKTPISYTVTVEPGGESCTSSSTSCTITGLKLGTSYSFKIAANGATKVARGDVAAPKIESSKSPNVLGSGSVPVEATCTKAECIGIANVTVARRVYKGNKQIGWKHLVLAQARIHLKAGQKEVLHLTDTALGRSLLPRQTAYWLRRHPEFRLTLTSKLFGSMPDHNPTFLKVASN